VKRALGRNRFHDLRFEEKSAIVTGPRFIVPKSMKVVRHPDGKVTIRPRVKLPGAKHALAPAQFD